MDKIIHIYHNCFIVCYYRFNIIFDLFDEAFYSHDCFNEIYSEVSKDLKGEPKRNYFIFSHFHQDHFSENIVRRFSGCENIKILVPDYENIVNPDKNVFFAGADKVSVLDDMSVRTVRSNDEGLAYIISLKEENIYFGGDLACWSWSDNSMEERELYENYYFEVLNELKEERFGIAFTNADPRLENLSGVTDFAERIKADYIIPMHFFGNYDIEIPEKIKKTAKLLIPERPCSTILYAIDDTEVNSVIY